MLISRASSSKLRNNPRIPKAQSSAQLKIRADKEKIQGRGASHNDHLVTDEVASLVEVPGNLKGSHGLTFIELVSSIASMPVKKKLSHKSCDNYNQLKMRRDQLEPSPVIWNKLSSVDRDIIAYMASNKEVSRSDLAQHLKKSDATISNHVKVLINQGLVKPNGSMHDPGRTYSIVCEEEL